VLPCIFGCSFRKPSLPSFKAADSLSHYLVCPVQWRIIESVCELPCGSSAVERLGVSQRSADLRVLAIAHHIYHYCKFTSSFGVVSNMYTYQLGALVEEAVAAVRVAVSELL